MSDPTNDPKKLTPLEKARLVQAERRANGLAEPKKNPLQKAAANPASLRLAVTAKCWDCCGGGQDPDTRGTIRNCEARRCPLWPVRPYQKHDAD